MTQYPIEYPISFRKFNGNTEIDLLRLICSWCECLHAYEDRAPTELMLSLSNQHDECPESNTLESKKSDSSSLY